MANNDDVLFDADRMTLHNYLYTLCLSFIIRHEIWHIANGHVDYLRSQLCELFYEHSNNTLSPLDNQTLEMDADSCVFAGLLAGLLTDTTQKEQIPEELDREWNIYVNPLLHPISLLLFAFKKSN